MIGYWFMAAAVLVGFVFSLMSGDYATAVWALCAGVWCAAAWQWERNYRRLLELVTVREST